MWAGGGSRIRGTFLDVGLRVPHSGFNMGCNRTWQENDSCVPRDVQATKNTSQ